MILVPLVALARLVALLRVFGTQGLLVGLASTFVFGSGPTRFGLPLFLLPTMFFDQCFATLVVDVCLLFALLVAVFVEWSPPRSWQTTKVVLRFPSEKKSPI